MTEQFSPTRFYAAAAPRSNFAVRSEKARPSVLTVFIPVVCGLGFLTVLGVNCYSASTNIAQKASVIQTTKIVEIRPAVPPDNDDDLLEPMVPTHPDLVLPATPDPVQTIESPFAKDSNKSESERKTAKTKVTPTRKASLAPLVEIVVAPKAEELAGSSMKVESADAIAQPGADEEYAAPDAPKTVEESPVPVPEEDSKPAPPND